MSEGLSRDLMPCPLCGGTAQFKRNTYYTVECDGCGVHTDKGMISQELAAARWNERKNWIDRCPICGHKADVHYRPGRGCFVECGDFGCMLTTRGYDTAEEAIAAWNRRIGDGA